MERENSIQKSNTALVAKKAQQIGTVSSTTNLTNPETPIVTLPNDEIIEATHVTTTSTPQVICNQATATAETVRNAKQAVETTMQAIQSTVVTVREVAQIRQELKEQGAWQEIKDFFNWTLNTEIYKNEVRKIEEEKQKIMEEKHELAIKTLNEELCDREEKLNKIIHSFEEETKNAICIFVENALKRKNEINIQSKKLQNKSEFDKFTSIDHIILTEALNDMTQDILVFANNAKVKIRHVYNTATTSLLNETCRLKSENKSLTVDIKEERKNSLLNRKKQIEQILEDTMSGIDTLIQDIRTSVVRLITVTDPTKTPGISR